MSNAAIHPQLSHDVLKVSDNKFKFGLPLYSELLSLNEIYAALLNFHTCLENSGEMPSTSQREFPFALKALINSFAFGFASCRKWLFPSVAAMNCNFPFLNSRAGQGIFPPGAECVVLQLRLQHNGVKIAQLLWDIGRGNTTQQKLMKFPQFSDLQHVPTLQVAKMLLHIYDHILIPCMRIARGSISSKVQTAEL